MREVIHTERHLEPVHGTLINIRKLRAGIEAQMSPSAYYQHFKSPTSLTPIQYLKQLRLLEARRLMVAEGANVTSVAYQVGYESISQFSREYSRMFGASPKRDVAELQVAVE
jgi:AraC-like DNA-binding protein